MRTTVAAMLAACVFAYPVLAQTEGQPAKQDQAVEKLWKIETTGIGG
jgi:hypothetical protein